MWGNGMSGEKIEVEGKKNMESYIVDEKEGEREDMEIEWCGGT